MLLSGGLDSYTAGAIAREAGFDLYALTVKYGQRHGQEILASRKVAEALGAKAHRELAVDLAALALEHNCPYITTDRDFSRFPRLRWQHPLDQDRPTQNPK